MASPHRQPQLRLVQDAPPPINPLSNDPARRIFEHWLVLFARSPARCKLGPTRRAAINAALAMGYDEPTLCLAIEGMAADPLDDCSAARIRDAMREIEWLLAREARIERWADRGELLRAQADELQAQQSAAAGQPQADAALPDADAIAQAMAARQRLAALAARLRGGALPLQAHQGMGHQGLGHD